MNQNSDLKVAQTIGKRLIGPWLTKHRSKIKQLWESRFLRRMCHKPGQSKSGITGIWGEGFWWKVPAGSFPTVEVDHSKHPPQKPKTPLPLPPPTAKATPR